MQRYLVKINFHLLLLREKIYTTLIRQVHVISWIACAIVLWKIKNKKDPQCISFEVDRFLLFDWKSFVMITALRLKGRQNWLNYSFALFLISCLSCSVTVYENSYDIHYSFTLSQKIYTSILQCLFNLIPKVWKTCMTV